jgi:hypothetical protein
MKFSRICHYLEHLCWRVFPSRSSTFNGKNLTSCVQHLQFNFSRLANYIPSSTFNLRNDSLNLWEYYVNNVNDNKIIL